MAARARSEPIHASSLLDSGLDDIMVPSLQPLSPSKLRSSVQPGIRKQLDTNVLMDQGVENLLIPVLEPQRVSSRFRATATTTHVEFPWLTRRVHVKRQSFDNMRAPTTVRWDGKLRWAMKGCSVFDNPDEEIDAFLYRPNVVAKESLSELWVFQYGLRYIPAKDEKDVYRTVKIEKLPSDVTMKQILPLIHGEIYSAHLLDTVPILGYKTALVTFVRQADCLSFAESSGGKLDMGPAQAEATLVQTPTYPMSAEMTRSVLDKGRTRCICICGLRETMKGEVHRILARSAHLNYVECIEDGQVVGEVYVRFHSIKVAIAVHKLLEGHPSLGGCKFRFLKARQENRQPRIGIWD
ncbi:hypothetical protein BO70DRAFT_333596 [Aspergillus heteromorphus CBS 117.55]|uniref:Uncharacterized protein n=1 Tax=Aspergillus heteromorphus CBS 117.55 TaxID=1448321 RepID=A0A317WMJ3_9EURO|nr:uncharacterized protein BO70DRAFT_333596 [Aspergillus heteromorphus CBS 117.55]PWY86931.1 hypothetical protein BO70DRAFT_333596 [Aspergillus heteromorphus CBS 117.55]